LPSLSTISWALLGVLSYERELSGYDIRKWIHWSMRYFFGSPAYSQIYAELKKLEKLGLLTSRVDGTGPRYRRLYKITAAGVNAVSRWAKDTPAELPTLKHPAILRVMLGHLSDPAALKQMLLEYIAQIDELQHEAAKDARWAGADPSWAYAKLALAWADRYYTAERELALTLISDLEQAGPGFPSVGDGNVVWPEPEYWYEIERKADAENAD